MGGWETNSPGISEIPTPPNPAILGEVSGWPFRRNPNKEHWMGRRHE